MRKYKYSIIYALFLIVINFFHFRVEKWIAGLTGKNFPLYLIYALFLAFFLVVLFKKVSAKKNMEIAVVLLTMGLVFFFLFSWPVFSFQMNVLEMFILGIFLSKESIKSKSLAPFFILAAAAISIEIASNLSIGSHFYYLDAWRNVLIALSGYLSGWTASTP